MSFYSFLLNRNLSTIHPISKFLSEKHFKNKNWSFEQYSLKHRLEYNSRGIPDYGWSGSPYPKKTNKFKQIMRLRKNNQNKKQTGGATRAPPENQNVNKTNYAKKSLGTMVMPAPTGASCHMPPPSWLFRALGRGTGAWWAAGGSLAFRLLMTDFSSSSTNLVTWPIGPYRAKIFHF